MQDPGDQGISIHTGFPNPATDKSLGNLDLHQFLIPRPTSTFLFQITGDQWADQGIRDGDIAVVDRALDAHRNDIVIWWHEEAGEFSTSVRSAMPPEANMWGVITATIHRYRTS